MQASVYRLRQRGVKLPRPQQFVAGQLLLTKGLDSANRPTLKAQLLNDNGGLALASLLGDEIGYDYPATTVERLGLALEAESDADTKALLERIRAHLRAYLAQLDALPRLRELAVPAGLQRAFRKARAKQMEDGMREARRDSVFAQIVTQVHIKGGQSSFQYFQNDFTEPMGLKPMSYSFELPRREALDPVGNAYRLHTNRVSRRNPE